MKTAPFIFILCFPLLAFSQSAPGTNSYPIVAEGENLILQHLPDSALSLAQKTLSQPNIDYFKQRQAYFLLGKATFTLGMPEDAIIPFQKSLVLSQKNNDQYLLLRSLIGLSAALGDKEPPQIDSSMFYLESAASIAEKLKDTISLSKIYSHRANLFNLSGDYENALANNRLCEDLLKNTNYEYERGFNSYVKANNLMELFYRKKEKENLLEAKQAYLYAIDVFKKTNRRENEAHARNALAGCLFYFDDLQNAEKEAQESVKLGIGLNDEGILLNGYYTLASLYEMQNNETAGIAVLEKLNTLLDKTGRKGDVTFIKEQFSNNDVKISSALINNKIEIFRKQLENSQLEKRMLWGGSIAFLVIILAIGFLIYYRQRNLLNIQKRKVLEEKQKVLEEEQKVLQEKLKNLTQTREIEYIQARLQGEEQGRHRIAQQIHDGVGGLLISTKWNLESALKDLSKSENKVANRLQENLRLQENSYLELRRVMYELDRTDDAPWWETLQQFCQQMAQHKNVKIEYYTYNLDKNASGATGEEVRLVIQELITNALKHAKASEISIQVSQIDGELDVIVEDNGIGFNKQTMTSGIGMRSINDRVKKLNGHYSIESKEGAGTIVFMDVPLNPQNAMESSDPIYASAN